MAYSGLEEAEEEGAWTSVSMRRIPLVGLLFPFLYLGPGVSDGALPAWIVVQCLQKPQANPFLPVRKSRRLCIILSRARLGRRAPGELVCMRTIRLGAVECK